MHGSVAAATSDVDVGGARVRLEVLRVVERGVPFRGVGVAHLQHDLGPCRRRSAARGPGRRLRGATTSSARQCRAQAIGVGATVMMAPAEASPIPRPRRDAFVYYRKRWPMCMSAGAAYHIAAARRCRHDRAVEHAGRAGAHPAHLPPFLLTGCALVIGAIGDCAMASMEGTAADAAARDRRPFRVSISCCFSRCAQTGTVRWPISVSYLRPLLGVQCVLTPVLLPGWRLTWLAWTGGAPLGLAERRTGNRRQRRRRARCTRARSSVSRFGVRGIRDRCGRATRCYAARAYTAVFHGIVGDRYGLRVGIRGCSRSRAPRVCSSRERRWIPATSSNWLRVGPGADGRGVLSCGTSRCEARRSARDRRQLAYATPLLSTAVAAPVTGRAR